MHEVIWKNCLQYIKERIPHQSFKTWFEPINPLKSSGNILTIQVPSQFFYEWLEENYVHLLREALAKEMGADARLEYSVVMKNDDQDNLASTSVKINGTNDQEVNKSKTIDPSNSIRSRGPLPQPPV